MEKKFRQGNRTILSVPLSIYDHLIESMVSCPEFRVYMKGLDPPILQKIVQVEPHIMAEALESLYDAVHAQGQGNADYQAYIKPDCDDRRDFWDVIDDI